MHSFAEPTHQAAMFRQKAARSTSTEFARADAAPRGGFLRAWMSAPVRLSMRSVLACAMTFTATTTTTTAHAQDDGTAIMIAGPAETNPAAVIAMAKNAGMSVAGNPSSGANPPASQTNPQINSPMTPRWASTPAQRGYARAATAADAAMRAAALALDARADAADASSSSADTSGFIVIPGPGEAKSAPPKLAMSPSRNLASPDANGMIEIPGNGEPNAAANSAISNGGNGGDVENGASSARAVVAAQALRQPPSRVQPIAQTQAQSRGPLQPATTSRDVTPVTVQTDNASSQETATPNRIATRGYQVRPITAASAMPIAGGMMPVSMRPATPVRAPVQAALATSSANPQATQAAQATQDSDSIRAAALVFLTQQAAGLPGKADITVTPVFPRGLASCATLEPFMPTGARLWGRTTVGVRCSGDRPWTLYLQARVSLKATYYLAARAIVPGEVLSAADLIPRDGDLTTMPQAVVTDPAQAVGAVALSRIVAGLPLRTDMLRGAGSIAIGQTVRVVTDGAGFSISAEGSAMNNATPGQQIRVKTAAGQIISGIVKDSSTVEIRL
jgi:flagella basal body P-ring formation protein FlgA